MAAAFETVIQLQLQKFTPEAARKKHIEIARKGLAEFMARQQDKPGYTIETDGRLASNENSVRPFGVITYRFQRIREIAAFALAEAQRLSPVRSGRYRRAWFVMANNAEVAIDAIPRGAEIMVTNDQPYSRKINVGAKGFEKYAPPGVVEKVKELVKRRYGRVVDARVVFVTLAGGHKLRQDQIRRNGRRRRDARKGMDITYPALRITSKF